MVRRNVRRRLGRRIKGLLPASMRGIGPRRARRRTGPGAQGARRRVNYGKRRFGPAGIPARKRVRRTDNVSGSYQFTRAKRVTGRFKSESMLNRTLMKGAQEMQMYAYRGTKLFDNNGFFPMDVPSTLSGADSHVGMPLYILSLNGINRSNKTHWPFYRLRCWENGANAGKLFFQAVNGHDPNGAAVTPGLGSMYNSTFFNSTNTSKAVLRYTDVQMNLWGSTSKSTRFTVQVVKVTHDALDPWKLPINTSTQLTGLLNDEGQQSYQELVKQYTFNPITKIDYHNSKKFKILKTYDVVIQPNATTDGDADPSCRTLKWFMKWDRLTKFMEVTSQTTAVTDEAAFFTNDMMMEYSNSPTGNVPATKSHLFLMIRATNYRGLNDYAPFSNARDGSFDLDFKSKWTHLD